MFEGFIQAMQEKKEEIRFILEDFFEQVDRKEREYEERFGKPEETDLSDLIKGDDDERR